MGKERLDQDWIDLIKQAKAVGLTVEEVRLFLLKVTLGKDMQEKALEKV